MIEATNRTSTPLNYIQTNVSVDQSDQPEQIVPPSYSPDLQPSTLKKQAMKNVIIGFAIAMGIASAAIFFKGAAEYKPMEGQKYDLGKRLAVSVGLAGVCLVAFAVGFLLDEGVSDPTSTDSTLPNSEEECLPTYVHNSAFLPPAYSETEVINISEEARLEMPPIPQREILNAA